jgi:SPX domain protein involved in polyphosphate accumulation
VKKLYIDLMRLQNYVRLNGTGFRKIVKKFDKTMHRESLPSFMNNLKNRRFMVSSDCIELVEMTTSLVSRDKLMDWKADARKAISNPSKLLADGRENGGGIVTDSINLFMSR